MGGNVIKFIKSANIGTSSNHNKETNLNCEETTLICQEQFIDCIPEEFFISIRALNDQITIPIETVQTVHIPGTISDQISAEAWFEQGIQTKFTIPTNGNYGLRINLHPHPFLSFGFFIQITPSSWLPHGIVFQTAPNHDLRKGVSIVIQFSSLEHYNGKPYIEVQ